LHVASGASRSSTVTLKLHAAVPAALEAMQVTALTPTGKVKGEVIGTPPSMHVTAGAGRPEAAAEKIQAGRALAGIVG